MFVLGEKAAKKYPKMHRFSPKAAQTASDEDNLPDLFQDEAPSVRQAALDALASNSDIGKKYSSQVFKCITDECLGRWLRSEATRGLVKLQNT